MASSSDDNVPIIFSLRPELRRKLKSKTGKPSANPSSATPSSSTPTRRRVKKTANRPKVSIDEEPEFSYDNTFKEVDPRFWNKISYDRFDKIRLRTVIAERQVKFDKHKVIQEFIEKLLKDVNLFKTVVYPSGYYSELLKEFYANLHPGVFDSDDESYGRVFIRSKTLDFSPAMINAFLETPSVPHDPKSDNENMDIEAVSNAITGKENQFQKNHIKASALTLSAVVLYKIAVSNWVPTKNHTKVSKDCAFFIYKIMSKIPVNFGQHVFSFVQTCANVRANTVVLPFPSLICSILLAQVEPTPPSIISSLLFTTEKVEVIASAISISSKLLREGHVCDIPGVKESDRGKGKETGETSKGKEGERTGKGFNGLRKFAKERLTLIDEKRPELDKEEYDMKKLLEQLPSDMSESESSSYMSLGEDSDGDDLGPPENVEPLAKEYPGEGSRPKQATASRSSSINSSFDFGFDK